MRVFTTPPPQPPEGRRVMFRRPDLPFAGTCLGSNEDGVVVDQED